MIRNLFSAPTQSGILKTGMDAMTVRQREIAHRIANASTPGAGTFSSTLAQQVAAQEAVDLEREMVALADVQLRFDAYTKLLQKTHSQVRVSFRSQG